MKPYAIILNRSYPWHCTHPESTPHSVLLVNQIFTFLSLGIFQIWAKTDFLKLMAMNIDFSGMRLQYVGDAKFEFRRNGPYYAPLAVPLLLLPLLWFLAEGIFFYGLLANIVFLMLAYPLAKAKHLQYRGNHFIFDGHPVQFQLHTGRFVATWFLGACLCLVSAGAYLPFWRNRLFALVVNAFSVGPLRLSYQGKTKEIYNDYFWAIPFLYATCGLYWPWFRARLHRYRAANIWLGGEGVGSARGCLKIKSVDYFWWHLLAVSSLFLTFGLAWPWLKANLLRYQINQFSFVGNLNIAPQEKKSA